jgi:LysR family glycine cleavage system transcriptional activator
MVHRRPPLNPLRAFEAAARHMSFTGAARELNVTQVAVSRHIRALEQYLEIALFERNHRSIKLTESGERLFPSINRALDEIDRAVSAISMRGRRDVLSVHTHTTFGQRWLIPRLQRFHDRFNSIEIRLTASADPAIDRPDMQAVIRTGNGQFDGCDSKFLAPIELIPVCAKSLVRPDGDPVSVADVNRHTLLHSLARPNDWATWLASAGVRHIDPSRGLKFENSVLAYEAALQGIGIAMGVRVLVAQYLRLGSLVAPFGHTVPLGIGYYLLTPRGRPLPTGLRHFHDWLVEEINSEADVAVLN